MSPERPAKVASLAQDVLGYLNYSSGTSDPRFLRNISDLFVQIERSSEMSEPAWRTLGQVLDDELQSLHGSSEAFCHVEQAQSVLELVFGSALPAYREFHRDLLAHQSEEGLFRPFFIGRMCEAVLQQGGPWNETDRIVAGAIHSLNDYIGYRPVAVLRNERKMQPYEHEWVRPVPLWIRGAGADHGSYRELVEAALAIIDTTPPDIIQDALFSLEQLDELAFDPRPYDFDHPVNKRPNYLFGQWDMNKLDNAALSRRFVLQQAALDAMLERLNNHGQTPREETLFEEAAVLAGTMLMGSGVSGNRPDAHDSTVTLGTLVQKIAAYRDRFYEQLLAKLKGRHAKRLRAEELSLRQPFGEARQHFNHHLAHRRALQLQHVHAAQVFAALGRVEESQRLIAEVPAVSARMTCEMRCRLAVGHLAVDRGNLSEAAAQLPAVEDLLRRAIECGAMVDPWNILGFGGQFSLFPAIENSVHDHRVDDLLDMISDIFALYARIHKTAAATGQTMLEEKLTASLAELARWWDQFATTEVGDIEGLSGQDTLDSAKGVAAALRAWHQAGAAAGDLAFWRQHVDQFRSPKAYSLVIETLLDRRDPVAAMALLVQWLCQAEEIPLVEEEYNFYDLALLWMEDLWENEDQPSGKEYAAEDRTSSSPVVPPAQRWPLARRFLDCLEANAEDYWRVPQFEMAAEALGGDGQQEDMPDEEDHAEEELFGAAYEGVTYRDSADDGVEGEMYDTGQDAGEMELVGEAERIVNRLHFLTVVAQLWKLCATASGSTDAPDRDEVLAGWLVQAVNNHRQLLELMSAVHRYRIPSPRGTQESLIEYDRRRSLKETLLEDIIEASVEMGDAARMIRASMTAPPAAAETDPWDQQAGEVLAAVLRADVPAVRRALSKLLKVLRQQPLLYVALGRGGNPRRIVAARSLQYLLRRLVGCLPRLGMLAETHRLLQTVQQMELGHPVGPGAVTEFDRVFEIGCKAIAQCLVESSVQWNHKPRQADVLLLECLEEVVEILLRCWLNHSRGVRLSVLESVADPQRWRILKNFIQRYGGDLFTQRYMTLGNLRGILHQGVLGYLETLQEDPDPEQECRLLAELDAAIPIDQAAQWLGVVIEAVVENYGEYIDYNSITTQSDRGDMLYTLLDFLRLRVSYDRMAWNLRPVALVHQVMVALGRTDAAADWRRAVIERTRPIAEEQIARYNRLCKKYAMRLPSIAERLDEKFIRPLEVDLLCALVGPAVDEIRASRPGKAVAELEKNVAAFMRTPPGAGYELPRWLDALEEEVNQIQWQESGTEQADPDPFVRLEQIKLSRDEVRRELERMQANAE